MFCSIFYLNAVRPFLSAKYVCAACQATEIYKMETKTEKHLLTESDMQTLSPDLEKTVNSNTLT